MSMHVIGAGVGRTGTHSLKLAINRLGLGPCHHMEEVLRNLPEQVPLWSAALNGSPDWRGIYDGYTSAVDWPTARFFRELRDAYPCAKFVLTHRSAESWADSFSTTIYRLVAERDQVPVGMKAWIEMASDIISDTGFPGGLDRAGLIDAFEAHNEAVKATIPASRLLVFQAKDGWAPLCEFLQLPVPDEPFPRTNNREEFWERVSGRL